MTILVLTVGRPDASHFGAIGDDYATRIRRFGTDLEIRWVKDVRAGGKYTDAHVREREARSLREALPDGARVVALDPGGRSVGTEDFARKLASWSTSRIAFVIGGPLGLDPDFVRSADERLSLSAMTLPHELARVVLLEQVYRAVTILRGVPYHK